MFVRRRYSLGLPSDLEDLFSGLEQAAHPYDLIETREKTKQILEVTDNILRRVRLLKIASLEDIVEKTLSIMR